jgi:hypothetical protein
MQRKIIKTEVLNMAAKKVNAKGNTKNVFGQGKGLEAPAGAFGFAQADLTKPGKAPKQTKGKGGRKPFQF